LGIAIGLVIAWVLLPVQYTNATPADLRPSHKDDYVRIIGAAYALDGDLAAAKQRLTRLGLSNATQTFDDLIARDKPATCKPSTREPLIRLSQALGLKLQPTAQRLGHGTPSVIVVVATPAASVPIFELAEQTQLSCADEPIVAHLRVFVRDKSGRDLPNVGVEIRWANGDETIYTGLKPERSIGYADFQAIPGTYSVAVVNAQSAPVSNLVIGEAPTNCQADRGATPRGWKLVFRQK